MLFSIALALLSSLSYGFSDFFAARAAARLGVIRTTTLVYVCATAAVGLGLLVVGGTWAGGAVLWGAIAGVCAIVGFIGFYAGMAAGPMSLVSPLISVLEAVVPVAVAIARGDSLPPIAWAAIALVAVSALLISLQRSERHVRIAPRTVLIAIASGVALGLSITALDYAPEDSGLTPAFVELAVGVVIMLALLGAAALNQRIRAGLATFEVDADQSHSRHVPPRSAVTMMIGGGVLLGASNALLVIALQHGDLAVVSVIVGLYPLATIVLARIVLKERMSPVQSAGVVLALVATGLLALSTATVPTSADAITPPPAHARFDYQIGGAYVPAAGVGIVDRDYLDEPVTGRYNICYINAFQTQPDGDTAHYSWKHQRPDLILRNADGSFVGDKEWGEYVLDTSTAAKRKAIASIEDAWIDRCASKGFQAVEFDNLDTYTRFPALTRQDNVTLATLLVDHAHALGLAAGQKNTVELAKTGRQHIGFDFAITEECQVYDECSGYLKAYGDHVIEIEYTDNPRSDFTKACAARGDRISVVLRDRDLVPAGKPGYHDEHC